MIFFVGRKKKDMSRHSLETRVFVCYQVSKWGQWEGYKGGDGRGGEGKEELTA